MTIVATCHCGNIALKVADLPDYLGDCNCSICRRYKALWAYYPPEAVTISSQADGLDSYLWGPKEVAFHSCKKCACITHYTTTELCPEIITAINFRLVEPSIYTEVIIKKNDGSLIKDFIT